MEDFFFFTLILARFIPEQNLKWATYFSSIAIDHECGTELTSYKWMTLVIRRDIRTAEWLIENHFTPGEVLQIHEDRFTLAKPTLICCIFHYKVCSL
jgi:hypothetical protein